MPERCFAMRCQCGSSFDGETGVCERSGILANHCDAPHRNDGDEQRPYRCGAFMVASGAVCILESDHLGAHQFVAHRAVPAPQEDT